MLPRLIVPGLGELPSHELLVGLAVLAAAGLGFFWTVRREGLPPGPVLLALALLIVAAFAGGRAHFAMTKWHLFEANPWRIFRFSTGGLHAPGAIAGVTVAGLFIVKGLGLPLGRFVDGLAPAIGVGIVLGRLGCFLNGCCYGDVCSLPWGLSLGPESYPYRAQVEYGMLSRGAPESLPVHPLPLYFSLVAVGITAFLLWLRPRKSYDGELGWWLLFLFSASSALLEPLRADHESRVYWGPLPQLLWVGLAMTAVSLGALLVAHFRFRRRAPAG